MAQITDRAKRYRAQGAVTGKRVCVICGATGKLDVMHLDGNESHGEKANLAYGCRSCNGKLAAAFKRIGAGRPTNQYNPAKKEIPSFAQYAWAVSNHSRGSHDEGGAIIHATPKHKRIEYAKRIASMKESRGRAAADERWNPTRRNSVQWEDDDDSQLIRQAESARSVEELGRLHKYAVSHRSAALRSAVEKRAKGLGIRHADLVAAQPRQWNPAAASADAYKEFHGHDSREVVTVSKKVHTHAHLAAAGTLRKLVVLGIDKQTHTVKGFKGALLAFNEDKNQLFVEGGDQSMNLEDFGIRKPHEYETLGKVKVIDYHADKSHLGDEGGNATYTHQFRTTNENGSHVVVKIARYPDLIYDVRNEQLLFSGGSYTIRAEGIDV